MKSIDYTQTELKRSLQVVSDYLFHSLLQNPPNTKIRLGPVGYLIKKERQVTNGNLGPGTYYYYHCGFKKSTTLKQALAQQIVNS